MSTNVQSCSSLCEGDLHKHPRDNVEKPSQVYMDAGPLRLRVAHCLSGEMAPGPMGKRVELPIWAVAQALSGYEPFRLPSCLDPLAHAGWAVHVLEPPTPQFKPTCAPLSGPTPSLAR